MENRLFTSDQSLNVKLGEEHGTEWQDLIEDKKETHDTIIANKDELDYRRNIFSKALNVLNDREKEIIKLRKLSEKPLKLEELSRKYKISRERVRQIEEKALEKLQKLLKINLFDNQVHFCFQLFCHEFLVYPLSSLAIQYHVLHRV